MITTIGGSYLLLSFKWLPSFKNCNSSLKKLLDPAVVNCHLSPKNSPNSFLFSFLIFGFFININKSSYIHNYKLHNKYLKTNITIKPSSFFLLGRVYYLTPRKNLSDLATKFQKSSNY